MGNTIAIHDWSMERSLVVVRWTLHVMTLEANGAQTIKLNRLMDSGTNLARLSKQATSPNW